MRLFVPRKVFRRLFFKQAEQRIGFLYLIRKRDRLSVFRGEKRADFLENRKQIAERQRRVEIVVHRGIEVFIRLRGVLFVVAVRFQPRLFRFVRFGKHQIKIVHVLFRFREQIVRNIDVAAIIRLQQREFNRFVRIFIQQVG